MILDWTAIPIAYLLGAIPFGLFIPRLFGISDIRKQGSGNTGATNVYRIAGPIPAIIVLVGDIGKGVLAVVIASQLASGWIDAEYLKLTSGMSAVVGHMYPIYVRFKGGKGVNTALGVMLTLIPIQALIALVVFILTVSVSRFISLGSILASLALVAGVAVFSQANLQNIHPVYLPATAILSLLIIFAHRSNIRRLLKGNENKFSFSSGNKKGVKNHV